MMCNESLLVEWGKHHLPCEFHQYLYVFCEGTAGEGASPSWYQAVPPYLCYVNTDQIMRFPTGGNVGFSIRFHAGCQCQLEGPDL